MTRSGDGILVVVVVGGAGAGLGAVVPLFVDLLFHDRQL